jgi:trehalose 6-phosphate synthase
MMVTTTVLPIPCCGFCSIPWDVSRAPIIDRRTWHAWDTGYVVVNRLFATAIVERIRAARRQTMVMLQDYHLYLTARGIRDQIRTRGRRTASLRSCPVARSDYWRILPGTMRQAILDSLCAVDLWVSRRAKTR